MERVRSSAVYGRHGHPYARDGDDPVRPDPPQRSCTQRTKPGRTMLDEGKTTPTHRQGWAHGVGLLGMGARVRTRPSTGRREAWDWLASARRR